MRQPVSNKATIDAPNASISSDLPTPQALRKMRAQMHRGSGSFGLVMMVLAALFILAALAGCAAPDLAFTPVTNTLEKFAPCDVDMPAKPVQRTAKPLPDGTGYTAKLNLTFADFEDQQAYTKELERRLDYCRNAPK